MKQGLKSLVIRAGFWNIANKLLYLGLNFIQLLVLARLLSPRDFGLMSIALLIIATLDNLFTIGFLEALIQKKGDISEYFNTVWSIFFFRGIFLFCVIFSLAKAISLFFNDLLLFPIIKVISFSIILQGISSVGVIIFKKEINFYKYFIYYSSGTIINFIVSIILAFILRNVWALVFGYIAGEFIRLVVSYYLYFYIPKIQIRINKLKDLFSYGIWVVLGEITNFFTRNADKYIIGKVLGIIPLGFYQMASYISNINMSEINDVVHQVAFPTYSKLQDKMEIMIEGYERSLQFLFFLGMPFAGIIFILSSDIVNIFLGQKWIQIIIPLRILSLLVLIRILGATLGSVVLAKGKQKNGLFFSFLQLIILLITIFPLTKVWGIVGTCLSVVVSISFGTIWGHIYFYNLFGISFNKVFSKLKNIIIASLFSFFLLIIIKTAIGTGDFFKIITTLLIFVLFYVFFLIKVLKFDLFRYIFSNNE